MEALKGHAREEGGSKVEKEEDVVLWNVVRAQTRANWTKQRFYNIVAQQSSRGGLIPQV